eukprot:gene14709-5806_t
MASANHVIAEFPYSYTDANGLEVSFEKGEQFILLVKATDDWWKVQRMSPSNKDKSNIIYVPANHVKEVKSDCPASPVQDIDSRPGSSHDYMNLDTFRSIMFRSDSTTDSEYSYSDQDTASSFGTSPRVLNGSFSPKPLSHTAELRKSLNLEAVLGGMKMKQEATKGDGSLEESNQPSYKEYEEESTVVFRTKRDDSIPFTKRSSTLPAGWQKLTDNLSGRQYYYNEDTKESQWKLPRVSLYLETPQNKISFNPRAKFLKKGRTALAQSCI